MDTSFSIQYKQIPLSFVAEGAQNAGDGARNALLVE